MLALARAPSSPSLVSSADLQIVAAVAAETDLVPSLIADWIEVRFRHFILDRVGPNSHRSFCSYHAQIYLSSRVSSSLERENAEAAFLPSSPPLLSDDLMPPCDDGSEDDGGEDGEDDGEDDEEMDEEEGIMGDDDAKMLEMMLRDPYYEREG